MIKFRQKEYTKYDSTDALKQMKDSDILAEKPKTNSGIAAKTIGSAATGAAGGAIAGGLLGGLKKGSTLKGGAKAGALLGGLGAAAISMAKNSKKKEENEFFNDRLEYAQKQARRREKKDWKQNMTGREGYTY